MSMRNAASFVALSLFVACPVGAVAAPWIEGTTDKDPLSYSVGEEIVFTVTLREASSFPDGVKAEWRRTGDDGVEEKGAWNGASPLTVKTKLARAGFVRLRVEPREETGKRRPWRPDGAKGDVFFDGGAAAGVDALVQAKPEPADFDVFWKKCRDELAAMPMEAELEEIPSPSPGAKLYKAKVSCPGGTGWTTGYLSIPEKPGRHAAEASFAGYGTSWSKKAFEPPKSVSSAKLRFHVTAHGCELGREADYYSQLRKSAGSNGYGYGFDPAQNRSPDTCYFRGMALRVIRAVEYLKTRPEWDGKHLTVSGGSMGSLQAMWCAAFVPGVSEARLQIPWLCDVGGTEDGRNHGDWYPKWAPGLDYFDQVNVARRVPATCRAVVDYIGLGDYIAPPCGSTIMYRALKCPKSAVWIQGAVHGHVPPNPQRFRR